MSPKIPTPATKRPINWRLLARQVHWMSAALCFCALILYAISGFFLNNENLVPQAKEQTQTIALSPQAALAVQGLKKGDALPSSLADLMPSIPAARQCFIKADKDRLTCDLSRPGHDVRISFDTKAPAMTTSLRNRGIWGIIFDLHRGKRVDLTWRLLMDAVAIGFLVFGLTGFILLLLAAKRQTATWPLLAGGLIIPIGLILIVLHLL